MSKTISNHRAVKAVLDGPSQGFDYKYDVELKSGWVFTGGRMRGLNNARFHTVQDFLNAMPAQIDPSKLGATQ